MSLSARRTLGKPTPEQEARWLAMRGIGCLLCKMRGLILGQCGASEVHHFTQGGRHGQPRLGHDYTIVLGTWHHRGERVPQFWGVSAEHMENSFGPSYARTPKAFRREFGNDQQLLDYQQDLLGLPRILIPTRRPKATMTTVREQQEAGGPNRNKVGKRSVSRCVASEKQVKRPASGFVR